LDILLYAIFMEQNQYQSFSQNENNNSGLKKLLNFHFLLIVMVIVILPAVVLSLLPNSALRNQDNASAASNSIKIETEAMTLSGDVLTGSDSAASNGYYLEFGSR
jgi:hypothetical protein